MSERPSIPRDHEDDYREEMLAKRRAFLTKQAGVSLESIAQLAGDRASLSGNIENAVGAAHVPLGIAGPLQVNGEHASGEFYVPMATSEGTLVASYSRGMKLLNANGGANVTVVERFMQRAPVFHFNNARQARDFGDWLTAHFAEVKAAAETTTSTGSLHHIEQYGVGPMRYTRFNYETGDAAGQNMTGKATDAACRYIRNTYAGPMQGYTLSGAIDTDKKHSQLNTLNSRGARVVAEVVLQPDSVEQMMRTTTRDLYRVRNVSHVGGMLAGTSSNGLHAANALAALFIATGQDAANVAESQASLTYIDLREDGSLYWSVTLPSLIVATYGGGTGLATQRECLELLDCYGSGKVRKFAEIVAGTVLAGELSLASAVIAGDWVSSHDKLGRNRP